MTNDLISREALQYLFKKECVGECRICKHFTCFKDDSETTTHCRLVDNAPAVDAAPVVHGRWECYLSDPYCSECGEFAETVTDYCPNCGAKMDEEET